MAHKKFKKLGKTINQISSFSLILVGILSSVICIVVSVNVVHSLAEKTVKSSFMFAEQKVSDIKDEAISAVQVLSESNGIAKGIAYSNKIMVYDAISDLRVKGNVIITDSKGNVIINTKDMSTKYDMSSNSVVQKTLSGESYRSFENFEEDGYSIVSSKPVENDGLVIGAIVYTYPLEDPTLIDSLKEITGCDYTIIKDDVRINTTLMVGEERQVGTSVDPKISETVFDPENTEEYCRKTKLLGSQQYFAKYAALTDFKKNNVGMLFAGYNMNNDYIDVMFDALLSFAASIVVMLIAVFYITKRMKALVEKPMSSIVSAAESIASGNFGDDIINSLDDISRSNKNEIGHASDAMINAITSLNHVQDDILKLNNAIKEYDLTVTAESECHAGIYQTIVDTVNALFGQLVSIMHDVHNISENIDSGAIQVSGAADNLANNATAQASSTEQLAANIIEVNNEIKSTAEHAHDADNAAHSAMESVNDSSEHMNEMVKAMSAIADSSEAIENIIRTIEDIAFQTNILALNAAVEAARAGEAGMGFAVVADEVRNLAEKSSAAVSETSSLISETLDAIKKGKRIVSETNDALESVITETEKVTELVANIAEATEKQSTAVEQINIGIGQISAVVQSTSATAEETAASSAELANQSVSLKQMVDKYKME